MDLLDLTVLAAAAGLIGLVNWYFFLSHGRSGAAGLTAGGVQTALVAVRGGYDPATIRLKAGVPVRLTFDRQESAGCSEEIVFPSQGVKRFLPPFEQTTIELPAQAPGEYEFTCGMSMLRGRLVVEPEASDD